MPKRTIMAALTTATALAAGGLAGLPSAQAAPTPAVIAHSKPSWVGHAPHLGAPNSRSAVHARVYLAPRGGFAALRDAALAASTPGSASYHHFLSTAQYNARFAPSSSAVHSVESWLRSAGLKVAGVAPHNRYLTIGGSVAQADKAFATSIQRYRHNGLDVQAPSSELKVPASLASSVLTVTGLSTTPHRVVPKATAAIPAPGGFRNARPCSTYFGQVTAKFQADFRTPLPKFQGATLPYAPCGYTGPQYRAAYEGATALSGAGQTVAITDAYASPTIASDANTYAVRHGDGSYAPGQLTQVHPSSFNRKKACGPTGWFGEETLDVEAVHAMAPAANIRYYASASCFDNDFLDTLARVVDDNQAQLVSNSWSDIEAVETPDVVAAYEMVFLQGAMQGISFMFSSGDNGDELARTAIKQVDYPASDPFATAVGGTSDAIGANGKFLFQTGWGTHKFALSADGQSWTPLGFLYGAGGGQSVLFDQPSYQRGVTPAGPRSVPDVGLDGDPNTGMLIGETQKFPEGTHYDEFRIGGTSLASPLFAGMTALSLQRAGGSGAGLLNPIIYGRASTRGAFTDVQGNPPVAGVVRADFANGLDPADGILYSVRTFNQDSSLHTNTGWDDVTGVGSPNHRWLSAIPAS